MLICQSVHPQDYIQANTSRWTTVVLMLGQRRRRCTDIKTTVAQRLVFAGIDELM